MVILRVNATAVATREFEWYMSKGEDISNVHSDGAA